MTKTAATRPFAQFLASIWAMPAVALLILASSMSWFIYDEHEQVLDREFRFLESNARIADAQISGLLRNLQQMLNDIAQEQLDLPAAQRDSYDALLAARRKKFPEIRSLVVVNAGGHVEWTGNPNLKGFDSSQRDYFLAHQGRPLQPNFYASRPYKTSFGDRGIAFSVAVRDAKGRLQGVVVAGVDPKYFDSVLKQLVPDSAGGTATLFNQQGEILNRQPDLDMFIGKNISTGLPYQEHLRATQRVTRHIGNSTVDGVKRMIVFSKVGDTALLVNTARPLDMVLARWRLNLVTRALMFTLAAMVILMLVRLAQRRDQARRQSEEQLRTSEAKLSELFNQAPLGIWMLDRDGTVIDCNPQFAAYAGAPRERIVGFNILNDARDRVLVEPLRRALAGATVSIETRYTSTTGNRTAFFQYHFKPVIINDEFAFLLCFSVDITERKAAEEKLHDLNEKLEERVRIRTADLEAANKDLESFSYSVSHDLRSPLRGINGYSQILLEDERERLSDEGKAMLGRIAQGATRLGELIDDVLEYSRAGRLSLTRESVDLPALVERVVKELAERHPQVEIRVQPLPQVLGDQTMLQQILENLIGNACKYSVNAPRPQVEIGVDMTHGETILYVRDNGVGFDMRYAGKLFGMFQRLHTDREFQGTGVGLAIVKRLVERHGGHVWADAAPGQGATFYFTLAPQHAAPDAAPDAALA